MTAQFFPTKSVNGLDFHDVTFVRNAFARKKWGGAMRADFDFQILGIAGPKVNVNWGENLISAESLKKVIRCTRLAFHMKWAPEGRVRLFVADIRI